MKGAIDVVHGQGLATNLQGGHLLEPQKAGYIFPCWLWDQLVRRKPLKPKTTLF